MSGQSYGSISDVLFKLREKGVRIWTDNNQLRYQAASGSLSPQEIAELRSLRAQIIDFLERFPPSSVSEPPLGPRLNCDRVPLTYSQQLMWKTKRLDKRRSTRSVFTAIRLCGRLDIELLQACLAQLTSRHESLRTRIVTSGGVTCQKIDSMPKSRLEAVDLTAGAAGLRESAVARFVRQLITEPIDVGVDPLFVARLLRLEENEHVLVIAMDHLISDGASVGILLRDLWTLYAQSAAGQSPHLANLPVQFADYAVWQSKADQFWSGRHGPYWSQRLAAAERNRLFMDNDRVPTSRSRLARIPVNFGRALSIQLRELSRRERTTLAMSVLCAYVAMLLRWSNKSDLVIPFETMGRLRPEVQNTIGYFASRLFLRIELFQQDSFLDLLRRVTREYGSACEHDDLGRIAASMPRPEFLRNASMNWYPREFNVHPEALTACTDDFEMDGLKLMPFPVDAALIPEDEEDSEWCIEPDLLLSETEEGVSGAIVYRADCVTLDAVQRFERNLKFFAEVLEHEPGTRVTALACKP
jgi:hypothetical protein